MGRQIYTGQRWLQRQHAYQPIFNDSNKFLRVLKNIGLQYLFRVYLYRMWMNLK